MNRRSALLLTMLLGGLAAPRRLLAQAKGTARRGRLAADEPAGGRASARRGPVESPAEDDEPGEDEPADDPSSPPADFPKEPGRQWRTFDITRYTGLDHSQSNPQQALIEWIFRRTESAPWHGDRIAVLCASRSQLRAYHTPAKLRQVAEVVERFTDATAQVLSVRVRFVAAADTRWRYAVNSRLTPKGNGPQGQQIWTLKAEDAAMVLTQMQVYQGFKPITEREFSMINGQTVSLESSVDRNYVAGYHRDSAVGLGYQPAVKQLKEGVVLRFSPLLSYEGDTLDAAIELKADTIRTLHRTTVIAPREVGPSEMTIEVPEVTETRLNQTITDWPVGQTLLISAGIHPGILQSKTGFLNLRIPGTVPTSTELLAFLDVTIGDPPPRTARRRRRREE